MAKKDNKVTLTKWTKSIERVLSEDKGFVMILTEEKNGSILAQGTLRKMSLAQVSHCFADSLEMDQKHLGLMMMMADSDLGEGEDTAPKKKKVAKKVAKKAVKKTNKK